MLIGVPKEIKVHEYRVGLTPAGALEAVRAGHQVLVQRGAGAGVGLFDDQYLAAGAELVDEAADVFARADLIIKVKEPQPVECAMLRPGQVLFTYLHLAADPELTRRLMASGATCIAYETVTDTRGGLPLLAPMSEVAGRMAVQAGAHYLEKAQGGAGVLLAGVPGVEPGNVLVLGAGVVGLSAARIALGMGARVAVVDRSIPRLREVEQAFGPQLVTLYATAHTIEEQLTRADLVIGAVLVPGGAAPKLVTRAMLGSMKPGSVLVDVAIDQGGCFETSHPTTHQDPVFAVDGITHYCVANMPGAVPRTSTLALTNATLPYLLALAGKGAERAMAEDPHLACGLNVYQGQLTHAGVAASVGLPHTPTGQLLP